MTKHPKNQNSKTDKKLAIIMDLLEDLSAAHDSDRIKFKIGDIQDSMDNLSAMIAADAGDE